MTPPEPEIDAIDPLRLANEIDLICDGFESSWKLGEQPRIEDFLRDTDPSGRQTLVTELVKLDLDYRRQRGELPDYQDYSLRFPELSHAHAEFSTRLDSRPWVPGPAVPRQIGPYLFQENLGRGAYGTVWKAWDTKLERSVAVKLPNQKFVRPGQLDQFLHEARSAAKLDHPHIVHVLEFDELDGYGYIVFRFVEGPSLKDWLTQHQPGPRRAAELCVPLADALSHAHACGVVHRDLKPGNVLINKGGQPLITDFGLAKRLDLESTIADAGTVMGTVPYMSPEQATGKTSEIDARSDIYSLGVILYQLLTGSVPFVGEPQAILHQITHDEPRPPRALNSDTPLDLETICLKTLAKEPSQRYATAGEFRDDLQRFLDDEPILARRTSGLARARRWVRRNRLLAASLLTAASALVAVGVISLRPARETDQPPMVLPAASLGPSLPAAANERVMLIETEPAGAKIALVPRDRLTGEPIPEKIIHADGTTPLYQSLPPDDYLVVAYLPNSDRFHEVYRHVPDQEETVPWVYRHMVWWESKDGDGSLKWNPIEIPAADITDEMSLVAGNSRFSSHLSEGGPVHWQVADFYMDPTEATVSDYKSTQNGRLPDDHRYKLRPDDHAITLSHHSALIIAERLGKRLPTAIEFEYAATGGGHETRLPWEISEIEQQEEFGPVADLPQDCIDVFQKPIYGLRSNVAEWTDNWGVVGRIAHLGMPADTALFPDVRNAKYDRLVYGGNQETIDGDPDVSPFTRDPHRKLRLKPTDLSPGLGFRCVRSAKPRLHSEDFSVRLTPEQARQN